MKKWFIAIACIFMIFTTACTANNPIPDEITSEPGINIGSNTTAENENTANSNKYLYPAFSNETGLWGYIDNKGTWIIKPQYKSVLSPRQITVWSDLEIVPVSINGLWGYIDSSGTYIIDPEYSYVYGNFYGGFTFAQKNDDSDYCFFDKFGKIVQFPTIPPLLNIEGTNSLFVSWFDDGSYGYKNFDGEWVISEKYAMNAWGLTRGIEYSFSEGLAKFDDTYTRQSGYIDLTGNVKIEPNFYDSTPFHDGAAVAYVNNKSGFIDTNGNWIIQPTYVSGDSFSNGLAPVELEHGKYVYIDVNNNIKIDDGFTYAGSFVNKIAYVTYTNGEAGYINIGGESIIVWDGSAEDIV